jgi:hypothetical protein
LGDWTIDICILSNIEKREGLIMECVTFLELQVERNEYICLDTDGEILSMYESSVNLHNPSDIIGKWWKKVTHRGLVRDIFRRMPNSLRRELSRIKFHDDDDVVFVEVAIGSSSKRIVSSDSDFGCCPSSRKNRKDVKDLLESFGIFGFAPEEAINELLRET